MGSLLFKSPRLVLSRLIPFAGVMSEVIVRGHLLKVLYSIIVADMIYVMNVFTRLNQVIRMMPIPSELRPLHSPMASGTALRWIGGVRISERDSHIPIAQKRLAAFPIPVPLQSQMRFAFIPRLVARLKTGGLAAWIVTMFISRRLALLVDRPDKGSATANAWNLRHSVYSRLPSLTIRCLSLRWCHTHSGDIITAISPTGNLWPSEEGAV